MRGGPKPRFPRTVEAVPDDRLTIEREKIRHRRPDDMRADADDDRPPSADPASSPYRADDEYDEATSWPDEGDEWSDQEEGAPNEEQSWDNELDDEWVFDGAPPDDEPSDRGIIWEGDDDIQIGRSHDRQQHRDDEFIGPEVELAGRRDVRPRAPKPRSAHTPKPRSPNAERQRRVVDDELAPPSRPQRIRVGPSGDNVAPSSRPAPVRQPLQDPPGGRFARTQATIEKAHDAPPQLRTAPPPQANRRSSSRQQPSPPPAVPYYVRPRRRMLKPLLMIIILAILGGGGWFAYREVETNSLIDGVRDKLELSGSNRTAADTPFGATAPPAVSPEEAVADLSRERENEPEGDRESESILAVLSLESFLSGTAEEEGSQTGGPLNPQYDPTIDRGDGPPLPVFKPRNGEQGQASQAQSTATRTGDDAGAGRSIFEQFWSFLESE